MSRRRPIRRCVRCDRDRTHMAHGLCDSCYNARPGSTPSRIPPFGVRTGPGLPIAPDAVAGRVEDYWELTREHRLSKREAAARLGVCYRTVLRYEQRLRAEVAA